MFLWHSIEILDPSLKEWRLIAKNININGYKSMPKDKLLGIIDNNRGDRKSLLKKKRSLYKPTRNSLFQLKR